MSTSPPTQLEEVDKRITESEETIKKAVLPVAVWISTSRFVNIVVMAIVAALLLQVLFWSALLRPRSFLDAHGPIQIVLAA